MTVKYQPVLIYHVTNQIRNQDHLDFDSVRQCKAVRELSRFTPSNDGDFEPLNSMLSRVDDVAKGMRVVMERAVYNQESEQ